MSKIVLVRSSKALIKDEQIGYGWEKVNFSEYSKDSDLISIGFKDYSLGRKKKQIKRFFNLKKDDIVIMPVSGAVAIAIVDGEKSFIATPTEKHSNNRIKVTYLKDKNGNIFIPRKTLTTALQSRLKIRQSIANLDDFSDEIFKHIDALKKGELYTWEKEVIQKEYEATKLFKEELLKRLQEGKVISISAGGYGLEKLVKELLKIKGYQAKISAKNANSGIADVDVIATKTNELTSDVECLFIQVKHHIGHTGKTGIKQLIELDISDYDCDCYRKILITTGKVSTDDKKYAEDHDIVIIEGDVLVDLIYDNIENLKESSKISLGITTRPSLL